VVQTPNAVAVLANSFWRARKAVETLKPVWSEGPGATIDSAGTLAAMGEAVRGAQAKKDHARGDAGKVIGAAGDTVVERTYTVPYLAHAAMEPVGCVAHFKDGELHIWGGFQDALNAKFLAMKTAGMREDQVFIHHTEMGGAFGRKGTYDYIEYAIAIARQVDVPVNLQYTREQDMAHDFYRNPSVARMRAVLGADGRPTAITHTYAEKHDPPDASHFPYALPALDVRFTSGSNAAPWGAWRSVDHSVQGFFIESFIDELAHEAGQDPWQYRRTLLADNPRFLAVLDAAAEMSDWSNKGDRALGIAIRQSFGTVVAEVAEVVMGADGRPRVTDVWVAADPGLVVNPDGFAQQMESGVIYGLTAALYGEITFKAGRVQQSNFFDYRMVHMADCPRIHTRMIESGARTGGAGEPGTPPIAAAVANAVFVLTGQRARQLPLSTVRLPPVDAST
jgi:isoquinoline 1-oxidoreductase subunit beta